MKLSDFATREELSSAVRGRPRDSQRSKLYSAENRLTFEAELCPNVGWSQRWRRTFHTMTEYTGRVREIQRSRWWEENVDGLGVQPLDGRGGQARARWAMMEIRIPKDLRTNSIIIHELAHLAVHYRHREDSIEQRIAGHGWQFAETYLSMVSRFIGEEAAKNLRRQFRENRVRYRAPKPKRELTEAQRSALVARLRGQ